MSTHGERIRLGKKVIIIMAAFTYELVMKQYRPHAPGYDMARPRRKRFAVWRAV